MYLKTWSCLALIFVFKCTVLFRALTKISVCNYAFNFFSSIISSHLWRSNNCLSGRNCFFKHCQTQLYQIHTYVMLGQLCTTSSVEMIQTCHQIQEKNMLIHDFVHMPPPLKNLFLLGYKEFSDAFKYFWTIKLQGCWITNI